jgi:Ca2+-binding RTX toxin-like protein
VSRTVTIANVAPAVTVSTDTPEVNEGAAVTMNAAAIDPAGAADALSYQWTVLKNGQGYATHGGSGAAFAQFTFLTNDDAQYAVSVTVTDGDGGLTTAVTQVGAANVAPVPNITGDQIAVRGQQRTLNLAATDPSSVDVAAGFTYTVNWGDGSAVETYTPGQLTATHAYAEDATYSIQVTATDQDNGVSAPMNVSMLVQTANVQNGVLALSGRPGSDRIRVFSLLGILAVGIDDTAGGGLEFVQVYAEPIDRVVIFGQAGNDDINAAGAPVPVEIYGGEGGDRLIGGSGNDILVGGGGADRISGNGGRDVLIGGRGADRVLGDADEDVLIGGYTAHDGDVLALRKISAEWGSTRSYATRVSNLRGLTNSGVNGSVLLKADVTTWDDLVVDRLSGDAGRDWFFANTDGVTRDQIVNLAGNEFLDEVDPE